SMRGSVRSRRTTSYSCVVSRWSASRPSFTQSTTQPEWRRAFAVQSASDRLSSTSRMRTVIRGGSSSAEPYRPSMASASAGSEGQLQAHVRARGELRLFCVAQLAPDAEEELAPFDEV